MGTSAWRTCQAETFRGRHEEPTDQVRIPNQRSARRMSHESTSAIRMHLRLPYGDFERFNHEYLTTKFGAPAALIPPLDFRVRPVFNPHICPVVRFKVVGA